jgi:ABC transporter DrrB family efflux protein
MRGYWSVVKKELVHMRRDTASMVIALMLPLVQLTLFGFAINFDVRHIATIVVDLDRSRESRAYIDRLHATQYVDVVKMGASPEEAGAALRDGTARIGVVIPPGFSREVAGRGRPTVKVLLDGSDSQVAIRARAAFAVPQTPAPGEVEARMTVLFNPDMRTENYMIPGLIAVILQIVTVSLTAFSLVREKEQGTLEQLMVTPVGRVGLMLGKLTPYAVLALFEMVLVLGLGFLVFDVRVAGSLALLVTMSLPFILASLSLGLVISTVSQTQAQALQFTLLVMLPSILMSGFVAPRETMPGALYLLSEVLPVTHFLLILRGIIVRGAGLADILPSALALLLITTGLIALAVTRFRKSIA